MNTINAVGLLAVGAVAAGSAGLALAAPREDAAARAASVQVSGGHETPAADHGRPVALVAGALGVPDAVFREAFSHVTPASAGSEPDPAQVQANKAALLQRLGPYGVTNERLDAVSNHYRYVQSERQMWPAQAARLRARVRGGRVVSVSVLDGGSGYTTAPALRVPGTSTPLKATLAFGPDFARNGRIARVSVG